MQINIPDGDLIFLCGGPPIIGVDVACVVKDYLYGDPKCIMEREIALGVALVRRMVKQLPPHAPPLRNPPI